MKLKNLKGRPIIVVGGAGYIGSHVCKTISSKGGIPIVFDNFSAGHEHSIKWGPNELVDLRDSQATFKTFEKYKSVETVIHLASSIEVSHGENFPSEFYTNNVLGTLNLLNAMKNTNARKIIFSSTCATYGEINDVPIIETVSQNPSSVYGKTKLAMEHMIESFHKAYNFNYIILRYFNAAGADPEGDIGEEHDPETHLIPNALEAAKNGKLMKIFGDDYDTIDGTCMRDYIHVNDIAEAHINSIQAQENGLVSADINIGTGTAYSVFQIINMIENVTGYRVKYKICKRRAGDLSKLYADTSKAEMILGFKTQYSDLENIIQTAWNFYKNKNKRFNKKNSLL